MTGSESASTPTSDSPSSNPALDLEAEFVRHLTDLDSFRVFVEEGVNVALLRQNRTQVVWAFVREYYEDARAVPPFEVLQEQFPRFEFDLGMPITSPRWLVEKLRERYRKQEVARITRETAKLNEQPEEALEYLRTTVFEVDHNAQSARYIFGPDDQAMLFDHYEETIFKRFEPGMPLGLKDVDDFTGGLRNGQLGFLCARPKRFKTFFMIKAMLAQAEQGHRPILFTLELTEAEIMGRVFCLRSGVSYNNWQKGALSGEERERIRALEPLPFILARSPVGKRTVPDLFLEAERQEADSILVDQLSFIEPTKDFYPRPDLKTADIVYQLKNGATRKDRELPVFVAAQLNREAAKLKDMAGAAMVALSDAVPQTADIIYGLHQTDSLRDLGRVEIGIIESRHTDINTWTCVYDFQKKTSLELAFV